MGFDMIPRFYIRILSEIFFWTPVQKIFGKNLVTNIFKTAALIYTICLFSYYFWPPIEIDGWMIFNVTIGALLIGYSYYKFLDLIKRKDDPTVGVGFSLNNSNDRPVIFNLRWIVSYVHFWGFWGTISFALDLAFTFPAIFTSDIKFLFSFISGVLYTFIFLPLFCFLHVENPKSSLYADAKNGVKNIVNSTKEALAPRPQPIPVRV